MKLENKVLWLLPICFMAVILTGIGLCGHFARKWRPEDSSGKNAMFSRYDPLIRSAAHKYMPEGWDWCILKAMIRKESTFNPTARSSAGAVGLTQLMPRTARSMGLSPGDFYAPEENIRAGTRYLRKMWNYWKHADAGPPEWERTRLAIASYNAGLGRVLSASKAVGGTSDWDRVREKVPSSTRTHVHTIMEKFYSPCSGTRGLSLGPVLEKLDFWPYEDEHWGNRGE